jgi:dTDP-4-dehydrorhamnose 3,5-epimerase
MTFSIKDLPLNGLKLITRQRLTDDRGFFSRLFCADELNELGWHKPIAQVNQTLTVTKGTVRGLHYQRPPFLETKLVSCIRGAVWDVAIDLRLDSPSFLKWHAEILSADNNQAMSIPDGFAHGFQTITDNVELLYFHSEFYRPKSEAALNVKDPKLSIPWPLDVNILSSRDHEHPFITDEFKGVNLELSSL